MGDGWLSALYVYLGEGSVSLSEDRVRERCGDEYLRMPAVLFLGAEVGVRTASLWWDAMMGRDDMDGIRWVCGGELMERYQGGSYETWPEHVESALARLASERSLRSWGMDAEIVARVLFELSYTEDERAERKGA